jgi:hypothetical protein
LEGNTTAKSTIYQSCVMRVVEENHCFGVFLCERGERATGRTPGHMYINHYRLGEKKTASQHRICLAFEPGLFVWYKYAAVSWPCRGMIIRGMKQGTRRLAVGLTGQVFSYLS